MSSGDRLERWLGLHNAVREGPAAVGSYPAGASPYGCLDMAGNVWEWCSDWYDRDAYKRYAQGDLIPPKTGADTVLRGGCWHLDDPLSFRCAHRVSIRPDCRYEFHGFRCVRGPAGPARE